MKNNLMCGAAVAALAIASPAMAAPPAPVPIYSWTGFYAGGNFGYSWGRVQSTLSDPDFVFLGNVSNTQTTYPAHMNLDGVIGGGQFGYNRQIGKDWVVGFEVDFQGSAERSNIGFTTVYDCEGEGVSTCSLAQTRSASINWFDTARLRVGLLLTPTTMVYGTGGLAVGQVRLSGSVTDDFNNTNQSFTYGSSRINVGYALGVGVESALSNTRDWTWKIEYLYLDLGSLSGSGPNPITNGTYTWDARFIDNILRVGLNYRFTHQ
jgi:outer membrane immunogenic protein